MKPTHQWRSCLVLPASYWPAAVASFLAALLFLVPPPEDEEEKAEVLPEEEAAPDGEKRRSMPKTETDLREPRREQTGTTLSTGATRTCAE